MNNFRRLLPATLVAASVLLTVPAFAAPHIDPKVVGHWRGPLPGPKNEAGQMDITFKADGTDHFTASAKNMSYTAKATYTTKPGVLTMTMIGATRDGKPVPHMKPQALKYTVTPTTLTLDDGTQNGRVVLHRVKG